MRIRSVVVAIAVSTFFAMSSALALSAAPAKSARRAAPAKRSVKKPAKTAPAVGKGVFERQVAPLVKKYCITCHGPNAEIAGINFAEYGSEAAVLKARDVWEKVSANIAGKHMPPKNAPQPTEAERAAITGWIDAKLAEIDCNLQDPGRVTMRRLNRAEYNNTIRDLFGVDLRPADAFPSDDVGYGFDNIGDVLTISPLLMEKYLEAAEKVVQRVIVTPDGTPTRYEAERMPETGGDGALSGGARVLYSTGEIRVEHSFPAEGEYLLRARAWEQPGGDERAKMAFRLDGKEVHQVEVSAVESAPQVYEFRTRVPAGKHRVAVAFLNDYFNQMGPRNRRDRNLFVDYLEVVGPIGALPADLPESHRQTFAGKPAADTPEARLAWGRQVLQRFAERAYRRPVRPDEVERLARIIALAQKEGESFERGVQLAVQAVLVSPHFLFRVELDPDPLNAKASRSLNDWELASRLSYFLWSSMPDDELFALARKGELKKPTVLEAQVRRMLKDPKSAALVENFGMQWLTLRNLQAFNPDPKLFPSFDARLRADMLKETSLFFETIMREDRSVLEFLDGKFTFVNERLARHYGIPGVQGEEFRRVELADGRRMGVLTQASVLAVTSNPTRTSPVKRGKWVLEQIMGTPPPPPPNVPELEEQGVMLTGTLKERMEQHRKDPTCASCHNRMDAIGFGLENFDAIGRWRETEDPEGKLPIDASGELPGGVKFEGPAELIGILKQQKAQFLRSLTEKLLTYALGRGIEHYDRCNLNEMADRVAARGGRFSALVIEIVNSEPFRMRRGDGGGK